MNRRIFLHKSSMAVIVAAALPKVAGMGENNPSRYRTELEEGVAEQWYYEIGLYHSTLKDFGAATDEEKVIGLKVAFFETNDQTKPSITGEYKYIIKKCELVGDTNDTWKIATKLDKKISGDHKFPKGYPKNLSFMCKAYAYVNILDKKEASVVTIPYPTETGSSDGGGCFLTTACVRYKGLKDDCEELQTLRYLRDEYMMKNEEGRMLISQYSITGPEIIKAIELCENKAEIYEFMYRRMILPSLQLIKKGNYEEAKNHYKLFVEALKETYC